MRSSRVLSSVVFMSALIGCSSDPGDTGGEDILPTTTDMAVGVAPDLSAPLAEDMASELTTPDAGVDVPDMRVELDMRPPRDMRSEPEDMSAPAVDMRAPDTRGLCSDVSTTPPAPPLPGTNPGAVSPFGVGTSNNVTLGPIAGAVPMPVARGALDLSLDLDVETYDVHVPDGYDGSRPYGLVVFVNSGNNGGAPHGSYLQQFADHELIQISPDNAGNPIRIDQRMARALLGGVRAMELFNIDPARVYTMGNSGGARTANMLAYQYPELFTGSMPRCGANYPRMVDQDYETREPDSHYEFWGDFYFPQVNNTPYIDYLRARELRFALMVTYGDFREGDVFNIYHNGMEEDLLFSRLIQGPGGHCATSAAHFADALGWIEHPLHELVSEDFEAPPSATIIPVGDDADAVTEGAGVLSLSAPPSSHADIIVNQRLRWNDRHGAVVRARLDLGQLSDGAARIALRPFDPARHAEGAFDPPVRQEDATLGSIQIAVIRGDVGATVEVTANKPGEDLITVFSATFSDWTPGDAPIDLRIDAWEAELQLDLGWHLEAPVTMDGALLLDDNRTVRVRWDELLGADRWTDGAWQQGSVMSVSLDPGDAAGVLEVDDLEIHDAAGFECERP